MLFDSVSLAGLPLANRIVMAPMTRSRAVENNTPNALMATYYAQRATAGLIVTEGTSPSPNGLGYARIPGIYSREQVEGWKLVTKAVHDAGGKIVVQLMHTGRIAHELNLPPGAETLGPVGEAAPGDMYTDKAGPKPHSVPRAMTKTDIEHATKELALAAKNAIEAGFDGVELHGANGYLIEQFLNANVNKRTDEYGGSAENRNRFALEAARAVADAIGKDRVGIRISPFGVFNDTGSFDGAAEQYLALAKGLADIGIAFIHFINVNAVGASAPGVDALLKGIREVFSGTLILNGGYDKAGAERDLAAKKADLIAFGKPFLANPDLVRRLREDAPLASPDASTFYTPGAKGYTDYPSL